MGGQQKPSNDLRNHQHNPQCANYRAPLPDSTPARAPAAAAVRKRLPDAKMQREERVTVRRPVKKPQPNGMSHGGGGAQRFSGVTQCLNGEVTSFSTAVARVTYHPRTAADSPSVRRPLHGHGLCLMRRRALVHHPCTTPVSSGGRWGAGPGGVRCSADAPGAAQPKAGLRGAVGVMPLTTGLAWESLRSARVTPLLWATAIRKWVCPASVDSLIHCLANPDQNYDACSALCLCLGREEQQYTPVLEFVRRGQPDPRDALEGGGVPPPPPSRAPSLCPATVPLTPSASLNGICNRQ